MHRLLEEAPPEFQSTLGERLELHVYEQVPQMCTNPVPTTWNKCEAYYQEAPQKPEGQRDLMR